VNTVDSLLAVNQFDKEFYVEGREAVANLLPKNSRCGIYVLHFRDETYYVGQSVDVIRRYVEHRRNYSDIIKLSFKKVDFSGLDYEERYIRNAFQDNGLKLRGVVGIYSLLGETDFDLIMFKSEQENWLNNPHNYDYSGSRMINPALRKTHEGKYKNLMRKPLFQDAIEVLRKYVRVGIPRVRASEASFWSCSCLPSPYIYARINMNWQEVFSVNKRENKLGFSFQMALSPLRKHTQIRDYFNALPGVPFAVGFENEDYVIIPQERDYDLLEEAWNLGKLELDDDHYDALHYYIEGRDDSTISSYRYGPAGEDQINFLIEGKDHALSFLDDKTIITAIRKLNLRLMRLGPCNFNGSHCLSLVDLVIQDD